MALLPDRGGEKQNYYTCCQLVMDGKPLEPLYYNADVGGQRGRTAVCETPEEIWLYACTDGPDAKTPEELRDELAALGARSAVMGDGGGKVNFAGGGIAIEGAAKSQNLLLVYLKKGTGEVPGKEETVVSDRKLVYLDPGHGGTENYNGSPDRSYQEHEFTLDMGLRLKALLERCGVTVGMTRETDETVSLSDRAAMANQAGADIFVSIHSNASGSSWSDASGLCVYTASAGGERDALANAILKRVRESGEIGVFSAGLYHNKFTVLIRTDMPACLVEFAFHTNKDDVEKLKSPAWREQLAIAVARGICDHLGAAWVEGTAAPDSGSGTRQEPSGAGGAGPTAGTGSEQGPTSGTRQEPSGAGLAGERSDGQAGGAGPTGTGEQSAPGSDASAPGSDAVYRVQVGAFTNKENAQRLEAQLNEQGYSTIIK